MSHCLGTKPVVGGESETVGLWPCFCVFLVGLWPCFCVFLVGLWPCLCVFLVGLWLCSTCFWEFVLYLFCVFIWNSSLRFISFLFSFRPFGLVWLNCQPLWHSHVNYPFLGLVFLRTHQLFTTSSCLPSVHDSHLPGALRPEFIVIFLNTRQNC